MHTQTQKDNELESNQQESTVQRKEPSGILQPKKEPTNPYVSKEGQKSPVQTKQSSLSPYQSKEGQKPAIQAKHRPVQRNTGNTNEAQIKANVSSIMGVDVTGAQVNYNSSKPAQLKAEAYAQGNTVEIAPGKEQHLGHELAHIGQQAQGRVQATTSRSGGEPQQANNGMVNINDDPKLEKEADDIGAQAQRMQPTQRKQVVGSSSSTKAQGEGIVQGYFVYDNAVKMSEEVSQFIAKQLQHKGGLKSFSEGKLSRNPVRFEKWYYEMKDKETIAKEDADRIGWKVFGEDKERSEGVKDARFAHEDEAFDIDNSYADGQFVGDGAEKMLWESMTMEGALETMESTGTPASLSEMKEAWNLARNPEEFGYAEAKQGFQRVWGSCGMANQNLFYRLQTLGTNPKVLKQVRFSGAKDADKLAAFLNLSVKDTTFIQVANTELHEFTIEKNKKGDFMHQGYLSNFNAAWWAGETESKIPYFTMSGDAEKRIKEIRDTWGKGKTIDLAGLGNKLADFLSKDVYGKEAKETWDTLPFPSEKDILSKQGELSFLVTVYQLENEEKAKQALVEYGEKQSLIELVMAEAGAIARKIEQHKMVKKASTRKGLFDEIAGGKQKKRKKKGKKRRTKGKKKATQQGATTTQNGSNEGNDLR